MRWSSRAASAIGPPRSGAKIYALRAEAIRRELTFDVPLSPVLSCFATTTPGVELLVAEELRALAVAPGAIEPGGVDFAATRAQLAEVLLWLRTANRVVVRIAAFHARSFAELERHAAKVAWGDVIAAGGSAHFRVTSKKSRLYHEDGIAERLERAVAGSVNDVRVVRAPSAAEEMEADVTRLPDVQRIIVRVMRDEVTLSADAAGALLHLRGYRQAVAKAPLRETLAAALLMASGWQSEMPLLDPMCGSGTIPIEAAMMSRRMAPGRARRFSAEAWPGFDAEFTPARERARAAELPRVSAQIVGRDRDAGAIEAAMANAERAGVAADIAFSRETISALEPDGGAGWVVTNPPYGARIGERTGLRDLYAVLGRVVRERRPEWGLAMLSADRMLEGQLGMPMTEVLRTTNGGIPVRAVRSRA
jgi:putative N6-adenine-specific DNA methylase